MILYILKSASCLALLLFFYHLILEKEKMHSFNRFYLLIGVIVSLVIPFSTLTVEVPVISTSEITPFEPTFTTEETLPILVEETIDYTKYILGVYAIISCLLFFRFGRNLFKIIQKIRLHTQIKLKKASLVLVDDQILPHTFWNFIFINKTDYKNGKIEEELFTHELTHVTQKHTIDVLLIEFLQAIFWINPLFIFLKKAMQLNHEFLADENVINQHKNTFHYQHILVNKAAWNNEYYLASNLNYSLTKKRLKMMTTQSSKTKIWLKKLAVIPLLAGFVFLFAERVEAQEIIEEVKPKNSNELLIFLKKDKKLKINNDLLILSNLKDQIDQKITKINNAYIVLEAEANSNLKKQFIEEIRIELSKSGIYQISFKNFTLSPNSDFIKLKQENEIIEIEEKGIIEEIPAKKSSEQSKGKKIQFKDLNKKDTIYVKHIKKGDKNSDMQYIEVIDDDLNKNTTEKYNYLNDLYEGDRNLKPHYVNSSIIRQNELEDLFSKLGGLYFKLSKENKRKTKRPIPPYYPYLKLRKNNEVFYKLRKELTEEDKLLIPPPPPGPNATKEEVLKSKKAYEAWKKRTGNDLSITEKKKTTNKISYKYRFSIYLNEDNKFDVFGKWVTLENLNKNLENTHQKTNKEITKVVLVVHTNAKKEVSQKAQEILKEYGVLITVVSKYVPWGSDKNETIPPPPPYPTEEQKNQEIQLNKYLKLSENYIGNKNRTKKELEEIKKQYALLDESIKSNFMSPDYIIKNMKVLEAKHKIMMKAKQKEKVYKLIEPN